jgi:phage shock protein A
MGIVLVTSVVFILGFIYKINCLENRAKELETKYSKLLKRTKRLENQLKIAHTSIARLGPKATKALAQRTDAELRENRKYYDSRG